MSDDHGKLPGDLGDLDWDSALDAWDKNTFVPNVARDAETNNVPPAPADVEGDQATGQNAPPPPRRSLSRPAPTPPPALSAPPPRVSTSPSITNAPSSARGGLGQLFAKGTSHRPPLPTPPPRLPSEHKSIGSSSNAPFDAPDLAQTAERVANDAFSPTLPSGSPRDPLATFDGETYSEGDPTLVGRSVEDAERSAEDPHEDLPELVDGPTLAMRRDDDEAPPYDPETGLPARARMGSMSDADTETRHPEDAYARAEERAPAAENEPTFARRSPSRSPEREGRASDAELRSEPRRSFPSEDVAFDAAREDQPASKWLDGPTTTAFRRRAAWLEEEARARGDRVEQARALLGVSELLALVGDTHEALALATEARDLAPELALAGRQARQLLPHDVATLVESLDAEAACSPTPAARAHATLLAADILRTSGDGDSAVARWNSACKLDPADVRAPTARAALALAQGNHSRAGSDLAENSELVTLDRAVAIALKLRGAPRPGSDPDAMPINDALRRARQALVAQDVASAALALQEIAAEPALAKAALWLSAAFGATHIAGRRGAAKALRSLAKDGEVLARRQLAARGIELGDPELVAAALGNEDEGDGEGEQGTLDLSERTVLRALAGQDPSQTLARLAEHPDLHALVDALSAIGTTHGAEDVLERAQRTAGRADHRALGGLGRLLASAPAAAAVEGALAGVAAPRGPAAAGVALEVAIKAHRWDEVGEALAALPTSEGATAAHRHVAAALVAERTGDRETAARAWREALAQGASHDSVVRASCALDDALDLGAELIHLADAMPEGPASAVLHLEALARSDAGGAPAAGLDGDRPAPLDDGAQVSILERVHRGAPELGLGAFLAERIGRRRGDVDEVLRWLHERRAQENDTLESALDAVREALLVADRDAGLASTRLEEAHRARPDDVALRELYERLATEPLADRGAWRERRAEQASGTARRLLFTEAALEHESKSDLPAALRAAEGAREAGDAGLSRLIAERVEVHLGTTERQAAALIALAEETERPDVRRATYERLAELERGTREHAKDVAPSVRWHETILESTPRHLPSLRHVEHARIGAGRDDGLERVFEQIALALDGTAGGEVTGHAQLATRFKTRVQGSWERTGDMARLAATQQEPSLWALRALNAHARVQQDEPGTLATTIALAERTQRPAERAALLLRASEAAARLEQVGDARGFLEQAANEDPGDVVTWGVLAELRERSGETRLAAEACESLARTSVVPAHQLLAWFDAARIWLDEVQDAERGMSALEQCAEIDVTHGDVFHRLSELYAEKRLDAELARLLEKRLATIDDEGERVVLQVELSQALCDMGELGKAKEALEGALAQQPDHTTALGAMADLCAREGDWQGAEQALVRLARLLTAPDEQRAIYERLAQIYSVQTVNLSRAEVAYKEVLKRAPGDLDTLMKLVDIYKRQGDTARAIETQQQIVAGSSDPSTRLARLIDLAQIHEATARDARRAEQVLESARKEFPTSVVALRAMAEFYARQRQMPAMQILLDRAAGDARRSFAAGRFVTSLFEVLHAAYELRGRKDGARVVAATLAAVEGQQAELVGAEARALDPRLDDVLAPESIGPALRALLHRAGDSLDAVSPLDLRALRATPLLPGTPLGTTVGAVATVVGLGALQILVSPQLGRVAVPLGSNPPALLVGEGLLHVGNERARAFVVVRALKMILARSSSLLRAQPADVAVLVSALFTAFNPSFAPQGVDPKRVAEVSRRVAGALPRNLDPTVGVIALEAAGTLATQAPLLGAAAQAWANRVALLAIGDPSGALDAIAWSRGEESAPQASEARAAWIARTVEARELMTFSVTDAYSEARARLGLDH